MTIYAKADKFKDTSEALVFPSERKMDLEDGYGDIKFVVDVLKGYDDSMVLEVLHEIYVCKGCKM